jgi:hypothetical protein
VEFGRRRILSDWIRGFRPVMYDLVLILLACGGLDASGVHTLNSGLGQSCDIAGYAEIDPLSFDAGLVFKCVVIFHFYFIPSRVRAENFYCIK